MTTPCSHPRATLGPLPGQLFYCSLCYELLEGQPLSFLHPLMPTGLFLDPLRSNLSNTVFLDPKLHQS